MSTPTAPHRQLDVRACPPSLLGSCARCHQLAHRYGEGGNPLCPACREHVEAGGKR
ncbi:hypothetical protein ACFW17_33975 [Streptomyces sp. NPDC058961]|uniref:hypothetical protein n=1 Tax=Streptomyces sp. NPDC058961 TaxID=3346680 RepID=UPI00367CE97F